MLRALRITILVFVLIVVGVGTWLTRVRTTSWERPLRVAIFPINADASPATDRYIRALTLEAFSPIAQFTRQEARRYGLALSTPVELFLAPELRRVPPPPPFGGNALQVALWSLQMRYWVWVNGSFNGPKPHVRVFVLYHDPDRVTRVSHSLGLQKGLIGVVNAFASEAQAAQNDVVIVHELMHTLGATDKYDARTNQPAFPDGYADPQRQPLLPQEYAEIMAGRVPVTEQRADMPRSLEEVLIGAKTAGEINWVR
jgi:hypothetical protein